MGRVSVTRTVDAPVADVHMFVVDPYAHPRWLPMIRRITEVDGRLHTVGATFTAEVDLAGRFLETRWRCVDVDPPMSTTLEVRSEGGGEACFVITLGDLDGRTEVHLEATYELPGGPIGELADRLFLERTIARQVDRALDLLRVLAED